MKSIVRFLICLWLLTIGFGVSSAWAGNKELFLDGNGDYVEVIQDIPEINFTIELQFRTLLPNVGIFGVLAGPSGQSGHDRHIYLRDGFLQQRVWADETINSVNSGYNDGLWHHYAMVVERGVGQKMYVDGQIKSSGGKDQSDFYWQDRFWIGFSNDALDRFFAGLIDEVRIWNYARTQAEIQATMNTTLKGNEPGLVGYWNFDDGTANDSSPYRNHGTLQGNAKIVPHVTLMPPLYQRAVALNNSVSLSWRTIIDPTGQFDHYAIYRATRPFSSISGMTPIGKVADINVTNYLDNIAINGKNTIMP